MKTDPQSLSNQQASSRSAMNGGHHPSSTNSGSQPERLSDKAFYLIALALLLRRSAEPGSLKQYLVPGGPQVPIRG